MLEVRNLKKSFGTNHAVDDVSFSVAKGTCFGLLGPNGAGKSTSISILVGAMTADSGSVLVEGTPVKSETDPVRKRIGYVPQEIALYEDLNAVDNLCFFGGLYGEVGQPKIDHALEVVGLRDRAKEPVKNFSGGMKRRLNMAVALVHEPSLLVLDEPTVGVDPQSRNAIFEALESLQSNGLTLLYTTHYMEEVERLCDQIAIIDHGQIVANDSLEGLLRLIPTRAVTTFAFRDEATARLAESVLMPCRSATTVSLKGSAVEYGAEDIAMGLAEAAAALRDTGVPVESVQTERPTLEEVFLHCTGRSLRDQ